MITIYLNYEGSLGVKKAQIWSKNCSNQDILKLLTMNGFK